MLIFSTANNKDAKRTDGLWQVDVLAVSLEEMIGVGNDLFVREFLEGSLSAERQNFPKCHCKRPDVTSAGKFALRKKTEEFMHGKHFPWWYRRTRCSAILMRDAKL